VRPFEEVETGATFQFKDAERNLAEKLIAELSVDQFDAERYKDTYQERVLAAVEKKVAGEQIHVAQEVPKAQVIDLFEALKQSLEQAQTGGAGPKGPVKASSEQQGDGEEEVTARPVKKATPRKTRGRKASYSNSRSSS